MKVETQSPFDAAASSAALDALRSALRGAMLMPGDDGYDSARAVWNAMIDRRPALIVQPSGVADVIDAVNFARENCLPVAVKGGGHNLAGHEVCDGGLMIDLVGMQSVRVDPEARCANVAGGATWGDVDRETQALGLPPRAG